MPIINNLIKRTILHLKPFMLYLSCKRKETKQCQNLVTEPLLLLDLSL